MQQLYPIMLDAFKDGKSFTFPINGTSMQPLLHTGDTVTVINQKGYEVGDIVLYLRADGSFVLHRVRSINKDGSINIVGDHQTAVERNVKPRSIIAGVVSYSRKGSTKINNLRGFKYNLYKFIVKIKLVRLFFSKVM